MKIVTQDCQIGEKVIRGRDWEHGLQDQGSVYGVILTDAPRGWVRVEWVNEQKEITHINSYRVGADDAFDLYYYEETPNVESFKFLL